MIKQKEGFDFSFNSDACKMCDGRCCTGAKGFVWLTPDEINKIVSFLDTNFIDFKANFLRRVNGRFALQEKQEGGQNGFECIFFDSDKKKCKIYEVRPHQCKEYPFWQEFKKNPKFLLKECPAILKL